MADDGEGLPGEEGARPAVAGRGGLLEYLRRLKPKVRAEVGRLVGAIAPA